MYIIVIWKNKSRGDGYALLVATCVTVSLICVSVADMALFFVLFESLLIIMFALIGFVCKVQRGCYAQYMLVGFTIIGSASMSAGILMIYAVNGTFSASMLVTLPMNGS